MQNQLQEIKKDKTRLSILGIDTTDALILISI